MTMIQVFDVEKGTIKEVNLELGISHGLRKRNLGHIEERSSY